MPHDGGCAIPNRSAREGMDLSMVGSPRRVTGGVDTHLDVNVAAALDRIGGLLGVESFPTTVEGNRQLLGWLRDLGRVARVGVEGTGSYGASLARFLRDAGVEVLEVDRPNRQERRRKGKNDTVDAVEAARAAQGQRQLGAAKTKDGNVEAIRAVMVARRSSADMKIASLNQIRHLGFTAPEEIRQSLQGVSRRLIAKRAAAMRPRADADPVTYATKTALRTLGRRVLELDAERNELDRLLDNLLADTAPGLLSLYGVGKRRGSQPAGGRRRQSRSTPLGAGLGPTLRCQPARSLIGQDRSSPAQPRRQPPSQRSVVAHRHHQDELRPPHRRLRRTASQGGPYQERDHPGPQTLRRPGGLPLHHRRRLNGEHSGGGPDPRIG